MASQAPTTMPTHVTDDNGSPEAMSPTTRLARHDTNSSIGSAHRPSHGNRIINISGACPSCHHQHRSLQVHVRIAEDSDQVGDVYCKRCGRLWVAFGNTNATRLSLLSTLSIEPDPIENAFRSTLIHMIHSVTPIAVLSPTLTVIPEAASANVSRETSVRSTAGRDVRRAATNNLNDAVETSVANAIGGNRYSKPSLVNGRRMLSTITHKARAVFLKPGKVPFGLGRWFSKEENLKRQSPQQDPTSAPVDAPSSTAISTPPFHERTEAQEEISTSFDPTALDVSASSTTAMEALDSLRALNPQVLQHLPHQELISWARRQLTDFRARHSSITAYLAAHDTENGEGTRDGSGSPRSNSILAYLGGVFDSHEEWNSLRERERTINGRPLSIGGTSTSDTETLVDRSLCSTPRHILFETLHRDHPRSLSPRPLSMHSVIQDWSQIQRNRAEARRSIDSTMTGGNVRSITTARNNATNRLSRSSIHRTSSIFGTEPTTPRTRLRVDEEIEEDGASQRPRSPSPSPETDGTNLRK